MMCASQKPGSILRICWSFSIALSFMPRSMSTIARPYIFLASISSALAAGPSWGRMASSASSAFFSPRATSAYSLVISSRSKAIWFSSWISTPALSTQTTSGSATTPSVP